MPGEIYIPNDEARRRGLIHKPEAAVHGARGKNDGQYLRKEEPMEAVERKAFGNMSQNQIGLLDGLRKARGK